MVAVARISRRKVTALSMGVGAAAFVGRPAGHLAWTAWNDGDGPASLPAGMVDDASRLERARPRSIVRVSGDTPEVTAVVQRALRRARHHDWPVAIAGARHTMGGHTITDGLVLEMGGARSLALEGDVLRAGAGARWDEIIPFLDARGRAVIVMQSNADFAVGGSLGANCHGWQPNRSPIASTVRAFTLVLAGGEVVRCSREENPALFAHAIGGYGLFGVMVEVELETAPNVVCVRERHEVPLDELAAVYRGALASEAELAFARLAIVPGAQRFERALVTVYRRSEGAPAPATPPDDDDLARWIFRGEVGSDYGKELRWFVERRFGSEGGERATRNALMLEPVARFANRRPDRTDILFEAFVPPAACASFARATRRIVERTGADLLNVTVRHVLEDRDTVLRYATEEVFALVMLFSIERSSAGDERLARTTRALIDAASDHGGRYYLPYRPHATRAQFERAYDRSRAFRDAKQIYDPELRFRNRFWRTYLA